MVAAKNRVGERFGRLLVLSLAEPKVYSGRKRRAYLCQCDCGNTAVVMSDCLVAGDIKSCGCLKKEVTRARSIKHGMKNSPEYKSWSHAKSRVTNPNNPKYAYYGGRGIRMCESWIKDFGSFFKDMGPRPVGKTSLGRIDVNGDYCKENCRWEDSSQQARARSDNVYVDLNGESVVLKDACAMANLNYKRTSANLKSGKISIGDLFQ